MAVVLIKTKLTKPMSRSRHVKWHPKIRKYYIIGPVSFRSMEASMSLLKLAV